MRLVFLAFIVSVVSSCNNSSTSDTNKDSTVAAGKQNNRRDSTPSPNPDDSQNPNVSGCYMRILKRDTMVIHLQQNGDAISGKMTFDNYEKDGSSGTVQGKMKGDVLELLYSFRSEGMNSVMEIFLRKNGNELIRGIGPMSTRGDTAYYSDHAAIKYPPQEVFNKVDCAAVPAKYK